MLLQKLVFQCRRDRGRAAKSGLRGKVAEGNRLLASPSTSSLGPLVSSGDQPVAALVVLPTHQNLLFSSLICSGPAMGKKARASGLPSLTHLGVGGLLDLSPCGALLSFSCDGESCSTQSECDASTLDFGLLGTQGKKKAKLTGTPDVVRFKGTREYCLLQASYAHGRLGSTGLVDVQTASEGM